MKGHVGPYGTKPNHWRLMYRVDGKQKTVTFKGPKAEAEKELRRILASLDRGQYVEPAKEPLETYLDRWLDFIAPAPDGTVRRVSGKTHHEYAKKLRRYVIPPLKADPGARVPPAPPCACKITHLRGVRLDRVTPLMIQDLLEHLLLHGKYDGSGLAPATVRHTYLALSTALKQAVTWQLLLHNPCERVSPPRVPKAKGRFVDTAHMADILALTVGTRFYMPVLLGIVTGMRRGEVLGLRWQDVDLTQGQINVEWTMEQVRGKITLKPPKTRTSRRSITLPAEVVQELREHRLKQITRKGELEALYEDHNLVCAELDGRPQNPGALSREFPRLQKRAGLVPIRFHDLRHSHVAELLADGIPLISISRRLGHSGIGITSDVYGHLTAAMERAPAEAIGARLRAAREKASGQ